MIKKICTFLLLFPVYLNASSQQLFDSILNELHTLYPQEKIYIQLDKAYYSAGETIWFKAYITAGTTVPALSKTMYAELINEQGKILGLKTMPILQYGAASHFDLPDSLLTDKLYIRAYTQWMLNFDSSSLYVKPLNIITAKTATRKKEISPKYTLTLFPEGGDLTKNIESRVAFKTNDEEGKPFSVSGYITDAKGNKTANFNSIHNGMGYFSFSAIPGEKYTAVWKDPGGVARQTLLADANKQGAALRIDREKGKLTFTISRQENASEEFKEFFIIGQINQQTVYGAKINLGLRTSVTAPIPTDSLPDGIMQITLFNKEQMPVAERIVFINNKNYSFITDLHIAEKNISARGKNVIQVDVGGFLSSNLSVAVTDAEADAVEGSKENIFSQLLLTGDLKGYVYNPAYYFSSDEDSVKQQLDLVMMTNGWRRFNWEKLLTNQWPEIKYLPDNYLSIEGNVFGLAKWQLKDKSLTGIMQTSDAAAKSFLMIPVNEDGSFKLNEVYFFDTVKLHYQFNNDKDKALTSTASFSFKNTKAEAPAASLKYLSTLYFPPKPPQPDIQKSLKEQALYQSLLNKEKVKTLETVTVTGKQISAAEKLDAEYASGLFSGGSARVFAVEDDPLAQSAFSVLDYLRGKVAGLQISTAGQGGGSITRRGSNTDVFVNESRADISLLQSTPMTDVALIKVFAPPFFGSFGGGAGGAVAVYTKKGRSTNADLKGLNSTTLHGYSGIKEFYMPDYEITNNTALPDYRTTLYWNPFLLMNSKSKRIYIPFYNNDTGKKIRVIIEGINEAGQLTREEKIFE